GRAEYEDAVHAAGDLVIDQFAEGGVVNFLIRLHRRDERGDDTADLHEQLQANKQNGSGGQVRKPVLQTPAKTIHSIDEHVFRLPRQAERGQIQVARVL